MEYISNYKFAAIFLIMLSIYAIAVWKANSKSIVVFRNYSDVFIVGLIFTIPAGLLSIILYIGNASQSTGEHSDFTTTLNMNLLIIGAACEAAVLLFIIGRTWRDNNGLINFTLALYCKIISSTLFFFFLYNALSNKNRQKRGESLFYVIFMTPLIYNLVADKKGNSFLKRRL